MATQDQKRKAATQTGLYLIVIVAIAVLPPARGRGSSRLLLEAARVDLEREGIQSLRLFVRSGNVPARSLYETAGFVAAALEMRLERPSRSGDG